MNDQNFSIGRIGKLANVAPSTIRYYEKIGLIPAAVRVNGRRQYQPDVIKQLKVIRAAQKLGWSLDEIKSLSAREDRFSATTSAWKAQVPNKINQINELIQQLEGKKQALIQSLDCQCVDFDDCVLIDYSSP
ncbi:MAG: MerR family transcriptional regulator [Chloroflexota bacterium]